MREALELALEGRGRVEPNPRVGAVCLREGEIVGRGYHQHYGGAHAEILALEDAAAAGAVPDSIVITMEPCSSLAGHGGKKTPPCTEALLAAGLKTVVIGQRDADPRHQGAGLQQLRDHGVEVVESVLEAECAAINRPFERSLSSASPWVIAKWAMTLDGKTATCSGESKWISGVESRAAVHEIRAHVDAVMVGYRTALRDDPELTVRHVDGRNPVRIVVDPLAALPLAHKLVQTAKQTPTWLMVGPDADASRLEAFMEHGVEVRKVALASSETGSSGHRLDLATGLSELREAGIRRLLLEGGGALTAEFLAAGCIHQVMAFLAPKIIGGASATSPVMGEGRPAMAEALGMTEMFWETRGADLLVHAFAI